MIDVDQALMDSLDYDQREWVRQTDLGDIHTDEQFIASLSDEQMYMIKLSIVDESLNSLHDKGFVEPVGIRPDGEIVWKITDLGTKAMENVQAPQ